MYILHSEIKKDFLDNTYGEKSLNQFGFIHCSELDTYYLVAPNFKDDDAERVLLVINTDKLEAIVKYEDGGGIDFPHVYGLINHEAIEEVLEHLWSKDKIWIPNEELKKYAVSSNKNTFKRDIEKK